ncbi:MAG TPA: hypothetical protein VFF60_12125 [Candidatus Binatus sp.]|nr:hypothetical protein [Candidatus Binatus sp.]
MKGIVISCSRYGCVVRLADGRIGSLPSSDPHFAQLKKVVSKAARPRLDFDAAESEGWRVLTVAAEIDATLQSDADAMEPPPSSTAVTTAASLDDKIIEYLRQTEEWDPHSALASRVQEAKEARATRITRVRKKR